MSNMQRNSQFVSLAAQLIRREMTQGDYDKLYEVAVMLNPTKNGYVRLLNHDVSKIAPHITLS